jgi:DNA-binding NtrC family response regulator
MFCEQSPFIAKSCCWPECDHCELPFSNPDLIVASVGNDVNQPGRLFQWVQARARSTPILAILPHEPQHETLQITLENADDFLLQPLRVSELMWRTRRLLNLHESQQKDATSRLAHEIGLAQIVTRDPDFSKIICVLPALSRANAPVLVLGETGTGKELCSRALHHLSRRSAGPFVPVDCGTLPDHLFENEVFGHARGAFTDAHADQRGLVALANNGTLFLDEIDSLTLAAQSKLLRFIQDGTYRPLGSDRWLQSDVRIIAATNGDLESKIRLREFRSDLFYRLNVLNCRLPPLRERRCDIGLLAQHFLDEHSSRFEGRRFTLSPGAVRLLEAHSWPGNVRELYNLMQRVAALAPGPLVLPDRLAELMSVSIGSSSSPLPDFEAGRARVLEDFDRQYLENLLRTHGGNVTQAARTASKDRRVLGRMLKKYGIDRYSFIPAGRESPSLGREKPISRMA